jgi:hypothetical protein
MDIILVMSAEGMASGTRRMTVKSVQCRCSTSWRHRPTSSSTPAPDPAPASVLPTSRARDSVTPRRVLVLAPRPPPTGRRVLPRGSKGSVGGSPTMPSVMRRTPLARRARVLPAITTLRPMHGRCYPRWMTTRTMANYPMTPSTRRRLTTETAATKLTATCGLLPQHHGHQPPHHAELSRKMSNSAMGQAVPHYMAKEDLLS